MENMVNVYFFGKKYSVPAELTIMTAMEYAGYTLKRGCGCRHGFCGACATIYRIKGLPLLKKEVLLHGDYCLPNIILNNWEFSGYIDLDCSGFGDRHMDVLWGIWTLNYNLGTTRYTDRFMDAYGRDRIETEKLRMVAAMEMIGG